MLFTNLSIPKKKKNAPRVILPDPPPNQENHPHLYNMDACAPAFKATGLVGCDSHSGNGRFVFLGGEEKKIARNFQEVPLLPCTHFPPIINSFQTFIGTRVLYLPIGIPLFLPLLVLQLAVRWGFPGSTNPVEVKKNVEGFFRDTLCS